MGCHGNIGVGSSVPPMWVRHPLSFGPAMQDQSQLDEPDGRVGRCRDVQRIFDRALAVGRRQRFLHTSWVWGSFQTLYCFFVQICSEKQWFRPQASVCQSSPSVLSTYTILHLSNDSWINSMSCDSQLSSTASPTVPDGAERGEHIKGCAMVRWL